MKVNKILTNKIKGINTMQGKEETFGNKIQDMVKVLSDRAEREVPEYGDFKMVFESVKNTNIKSKVTDYVLKITKPKGADEKYRVLEAAAYNIPNPKRFERIIADGSKEDILKALKTEEFPQKVQETFERLAKHFDEI